MISSAIRAEIIRKRPFFPAKEVLAINQWQYALLLREISEAVPMLPIPQPNNPPPQEDSLNFDGVWVVPSVDVQYGEFAWIPKPKGDGQ